MLVAHVSTSLRQTFPTRVTEWMLSAMMIHWSVVLGSEPNLFDRSPAYDFLASVMGQEAWSTVLFWAGLARLVTLGINGLWRRSPHIRALGAFIGAGFWFFVALSFVLADRNSTGLAIYPWLFLADAINIFRASGEAGVSDRIFEKRPPDADSL
jgi:hypothetical protein